MRRVCFYDCCCCGSGGEISNVAAFAASGSICPECQMTVEVEWRDVHDEPEVVLRAQGISIASNEMIGVDFDPGYLRTCMELWKAALDMTIPVHDAFKIHFMANRRPLLEGYVKTGNAWLMTLRCMRTTSGGEALDQLRAEIKEFIDWAEDGLRALDALRPG